MNKKEDEGISVKYNLKWVFFISIWTFLMSIVVSIITENLVKNLDIAMAFIVLIIIIMIGIIFDIIGIAVTTAEEKPFHAMAANKVEEARFAIKLVRNAGQVSNFCNDVIGDISGILSGAAGTTIIYKLIDRYDLRNGTIFTIIITSLIAAFTVGGKAFGKSIALFNYEKIIYSIAKILNFIEKSFGIDIFPNKKKNKK
ncbi:hypothetical protein [Tissierella praeacuta]|uniref:CNNM transmembrane domain-containing protein n=1 Tax=Tissierella praeacuta DSM 18095 TaxID=1123404 RepID=A0A1M4SDD7_9FIRM|nr:hypothetical protein [Tissierella praeacuta]MBU5254874.1 hypothetical protein [Tissierella praeacuta]TCU72773.1 hypothetical protein EV204_105107 [Tissierella praeacuta]SHE30254.1 hypothetical protein SAMN02745784_00265 [Tissierella praeacuta DSM 18095]SUP01313.1 Uncharacterised protein [Tissierella praeacuta]